MSLDKIDGSKEEGGQFKRVDEARVCACVWLCMRACVDESGREKGWRKYCNFCQRLSHFDKPICLRCY